MTFGPHHYMPVLKIKRGEKAALLQVSATTRPRITPLLEVVQRQPDKQLAAHLETTFKGLAESVSGYARCFLDAREIAADGPQAATAVFGRASTLGIAFTPVTGISRGADLSAALSHKATGLALRLTRAEFEEGDLASRVRTFLRAHLLEPGQVDLIIDLGAVDDLITDGVAALSQAFMADVPNQPQWRTFTLSACSFPVSMGVVDRHSHDFIERSDWIWWRDHLHRERQHLTRLPSFSDCAIQHPLGVEGFDPTIMQVSASVRYTLSDRWLLIKGESTRFRPPSTQFPELATRLVYGHLRSHFAGANHCGGCASIKEAADGAPGYGSAEAWRRLGTVHHISTVMQGLGSLPWP
jgi:hypothetical protein